MKQTLDQMRAPANSPIQNYTWISTMLEITIIVT